MRLDRTQSQNQRHRVTGSNRLKRRRGRATRYEQRAVNYWAMVVIASAGHEDAAMLC